MNAYFVVVLIYNTNLIPNCFSGMREPVPPILNEKLIQMTTKIGESLLIPCVAYANPRASYR